MQSLIDWTLEAIRDRGVCFSWMEEKRYEWIPLVRGAIEQTLNGKTCLLLTDNRHRWFSSYVEQQINNEEKLRPFIPLNSINQLLVNIINSESEPGSARDMFLDLLEITYPNGYYIWYVGDMEDPISSYIGNQGNNFIWTTTQGVTDSIRLNSDDTMHDVRLLQLYSLYDKTLSAMMFGEIESD